MTDLDAVDAMLEGVTAGPWVAFIDDTGGQWTGWPLSIDAPHITDKCIVRPGGQWPYEWDAKTSQHEACQNARFIAAARELVPALAAEVRALRADLASVLQREAATTARYDSRLDQKDATIATRAALAEAQGALREHHNWHLSQDRDANAWGLDPVDAYSGSGLCERTVAALAMKGPTP